jgi:hypothetical protein
MRHSTRTEERSGPLISLTDFAVIASEVRWLQDQGYTELAIWRHFLEHFVIDLDALALIIAKLFGRTTLLDGPSPSLHEELPEQGRAA